MDQSTNGVASQVERVAEHHVAEGAHLDTDVSLDHFLNKVWEQEKLKAVANALRVQEDRVVQVSDVGLTSLASVEEAIHAVGLLAVLVLLGAQDGRHELLDPSEVLLLVDQVKAGDQFRVLLFTDAQVVQDLVNVGLADHFKASQNQSKLEVWRLFLHLVEHFLDEGELVKDAHGLALIVEEHAGDVSQLNNEDVLGDASVKTVSEYLLEKLVVFAEVVNFGELMLEVLPDLMTLLADDLVFRQQNRAAKLIIVLLGILVEVPHFDARYVTIFLVVLGKDLEERLSFVVVNDWLISQLHVARYWGRCGRVHVVNGTLGHSVEEFVEARGLNAGLLLVEVVNQNIGHGSDKILLHFLQLFVR